METAFDSLKDMATGTTQRTLRSEALELEAKATEAIENDEGFSDEDLKDAALAIGKLETIRLYAMDPIANNPMVTNMYLHMKNNTARRRYHLHHMEMLRDN